MKRLTVLFVALSLAVAGCGKKNAAKTDPSKMQGSGDGSGEAKPDDKAADKPADKPAGGGGW